MSGPIVLSGNSNNDLRMGKEQGEVMFWVLSKEESQKFNPRAEGSWLILIRPDNLSNGLADGCYEGRSTANKNRSMTVQRNGGTTTIRVHHPIRSSSGKSTTIDSEKLQNAFRLTLDRFV